jgi:hypothetical protein
VDAGSGGEGEEHYPAFLTQRGKHKYRNSKQARMIQGLMFKAARRSEIRAVIPLVTGSYEFMKKLADICVAN